ncbi:MAG: helix-turn-helix domain-containing protein [Nocardioides sp.]
MRRRRLKRSEQDELIRLYTSGMGTRDVAAKLGIGKTTVLDVLARRGIDRRAVGTHLR